METFALLEAVLYRFRDLFGSQNFALFCAYLPVQMADRCGGRDNLQWPSHRLRSCLKPHVGPLCGAVALASSDSRGRDARVPRGITALYDHTLPQHAGETCLRATHRQAPAFPGALIRLRDPTRNFETASQSDTSSPIADRKSARLTTPALFRYISGPERYRYPS